MKRLWNNNIALLSFAWIVTQGYCNSPPTIRVCDQNLPLQDTEPVGSKICQVVGSDNEGDTLVYGLENQVDNSPLPFRIDSESGAMYLNESLKGRAGEKFTIYATVTDGEFTTKIEIFACVKSATSPQKNQCIKNQNSQKGYLPFNLPPNFGNSRNPSYPSLSFPIPVGQQPTFPVQPSYPKPKPSTAPAVRPSVTRKQTKTYPDPSIAGNIDPSTAHEQLDIKSNITHLVPIALPNSTSSPLYYGTPTTRYPPTRYPTPILTKSTLKTTTEDASTTTTTEESDKENLVTYDQAVKSPPDVAATLVTGLSVCAVFFIVGLVAFAFRKKIHLGKIKSAKDEKGKEPTGGIVLQEDPSLAMQAWRSPRAFSNRYEPWAANGNHTQAANQISTTIKNADRWEFPRHRLKFFSILGEGAFGQVWKCEALDVDGKNGVSIVAVKTLKENANEKERSDLISELKIMKMLEPHPNVVRLLGCCTDKEPLFLIMEYITRGKLQSYLRNSRAERCYNNMHGQSKSLTSRDLTSFAYQVAKGMEFLSSNGIIHRDLAARNVLITEEHTCKVADFGFARDVMSSHIYERKSEGRLPIRWMAPESLYDNIFSVKSDVWSFGVLIWEIVTLGSTPYPGMSAAEVMKKVRDGYRLDKPEHCRRELYNIMYYCWAQDPKQRPSFTECLELLEKLLMSETDYIELERFPDHSYYNVMSLSGEKL